MKDNKFAQALKKGRPAGPTQSPPHVLERGSKHVGGYFHPDVSRKLKQLALDENTTVQALIAEALTMLLHSREQTRKEDA